MKKFLLFAAAAMVAVSASAASEKVVLKSFYAGEGSGTLGGWGGNATYESVEEDGKPCVKVTNPNEEEFDWSCQMAFDYDFEPGVTYYIDLEVKGTVDGSIGSGLQDSKTYAGGGNFTPFKVTKEWAKETIECTATAAGDGLPNRWTANFGKYVGTCYITNLILYTLKEGGDTPTSDWVSIIKGGVAADGETESIRAGWSGPAKVVDNPKGEGKVFECPIAENTLNNEGKYDDYKSQCFIVFNDMLPEGTKLKVSFDYYCTDERTITSQAQGAPGAYQHWDFIGQLPAKPEWQSKSWEGEISKEMAGAAGCGTLALNLAPIAPAATFYINNVVVEVEKGAGVEAVAVPVQVNTGVYNLQGVKVADSLDEVTVPGLYITNGKKVIKK